MASNDFRGSAYKRRTSEVWLPLVSISHASFRSTVSLVGNTERITRRGITYRPYAMRVRLPRDTDDGGLDGDISIDDVERTIIVALRAADSAPAVSILIVRAADPTVAEFEYPDLELKDFSVTGTLIEAVIGVADYRTEPVPAHAVTPTLFPGAF